METIKTTPKDFFLWVGAMVSLYVSIGSLISLLFDYITIAYPDVVSYAGIDSYSSSVRFAMASLVILAPVFLVLMYVIRVDMANVPEKKDLWVRRWALVGTVFIAGATMVIDLVTLVTSFLNGDLTTGFILKVLVILMVASVGFMHFLADIWGFWMKHPRQAQLVGLAVLILVLLTLISGFIVIGSPNSARMARLDNQKIQDLSGIQSNILSYWQRKGTFPETLHDIESDTLSNYAVSRDAQTHVAYGYRVIKPLSFELCATFNSVSNIQDTINQPQYVSPEMSESWYHGVGTSCFIRKVDPELYKTDTVPMKPSLIPVAVPRVIK